MGLTGHTLMKVTEEVTEGLREHHIQHEPRLFR